MFERVLEKRGEKNILEKRGEEGIEETRRRGRRGYWRNQEKREKRVLEKPGYPRPF